MKNKDKLIFLIDSILVNHTSFDEAVERIEQCLGSALLGSDPVCIALVDESRTGKSRTFEHVESRYPPIRHEHGLEIPVLKVKVPSKPTVKGLISVMLRALGDPLYDNHHTEVEKTNRLKKLLTKVKTRLILLDEFQHFYDQASKKVQHHLTDWLKILVDDLKIGLVVAGLPTLKIVINTNEQLARRFQAPISLNRFDWRIDSNRDEFMDILFVLREDLKPFKFPKLESECMALRMYCASGGLMGYVIKILREATTRAVRKGKLTITLEDLDVAHRNSMWQKVPGLAAPFAKSFDPYGANENIDLAKMVGLENENNSL